MSDGTSTPGEAKRDAGPAPQGFFQRLTHFSKACMETPVATGVALARLSTIVLAVLMFTGIFNSFKCYRMLLALFGATNLQRVHQRRGADFSFSMAYASSLFLEDSFHYFLYAGMMYLEQPTLLFVIPPVVYGLFQAAPFLDKAASALFPASESLRARIAQLPARANDAFLLVAKAEIAIFFMMWFKVTSLTVNAVMAATLYAQFMMLRFNSRRNPRSRQIWATMRLFVDQLIVHPRCPTVVAGGIRKVLTGIDTYMLSLQQGAQAQQPTQ
eukprot:m.1004043 g.1004043  ORF g.1004043 m.1004043 type:complete len:271 (-) comp24047_c0_seq1:4157-4969(-)